MLSRFNVPKDRNDTIFLLEKNSSVEFSATAKICYLNGKLYVRDSTKTETPIFVYNAETLQEDKVA